MKCEAPGDFLPVVAFLFLAFACSGCAAGGIEKPGYAVERKEGDFEVRAYAEQVVAETRVNGTREEAGNQAFRPLFRYISGANRSKTKIAMTAPVGQEQSQGEKIAMTAPVGLEPAPRAEGAADAAQPSNGEWVVTFMMPAGYTMETLPEPLDDKVRLRVVPAHRAAAVRYSGTWSRRGYEKHLARLRAWMTEHDLESSGAPVWARYNAPFTPWFLRRNEVLVPLAHEENVLEDKHAVDGNEQQ
ncbi:MAG: heme-binding protein [Lentisphaerae bacterium]|nr:heme-binding protein [Lentisphaerota bacterium]